jgi:menaquinone-dependent protoporphyrinogen oxidase
MMALVASLAAASPWHRILLATLRNLAGNQCVFCCTQRKASPMNILVVVASRHGSTREIADVIAQQLHATGADAEVRDVKDVSDLENYDAVVLGSAIYMDNLEAGVKRFVNRHRSKLLTMPVWLFSSGPVGKNDEWGQADPPKVVEMTQLTHARGYQVFAGKLDRHALNVGERFLANVVKAPDGDFRDWTTIRAWADGIAAALGYASVSIVGSD